MLFWVVYAVCSNAVLQGLTVWRITGKIIRTTIMVNYICTRIIEFLQYSV